MIEQDHNKGNKNRRPNAWKRYGAIAMAGALLLGASAVSGYTYLSGTVQAEEETEKRVTLNMADDKEEEDASASAAAPADTEEETEKRVTLNVAADEKKAEPETKADTKAEEPETEADTKAEETEADTKAEEPETEADTKAEETEADTKADTKAEETEADTKAEEPEESVAPIERAESSEESLVVTTDVSAVVESCMPSIVSITSKTVEEIDMYYYGTQEYEMEGAASGIIIAQNEEELLVATNSHVVDGKDELNVCFTAEAEDTDDLVAAAKVKGMDRDNELAVVAVRLSDIPKEVREQLRIARLGSSEELKVGQAAIAIGNALGYGQSVTSGIISAVHRQITINNFSKEVLVTDAAINLGNSGGALLNAKGEVIGINVAKEAGDASESMGYSIPIDTAVPILKELVNRETRDRIGDEARGYMGATVVNVSDDAKNLYDMPQGAYVYEVNEGSAADEAGIKKGDIITKFDGVTVTGSEDLIDRMGYYAVGETVKVEVQTANSGSYEAREVEVTLQKGAPLAKQEESSPNTGDNGQSQEIPEGNDWFEGFVNPFGNGLDGGNNGMEELPFDSGDEIF